MTLPSLNKILDQADLSGPKDQVIHDLSMRTDENNTWEYYNTESGHLTLIEDRFNMSLLKIEEMTERQEETIMKGKNKTGGHNKTDL